MKAQNSVKPCRVLNTPPEQLRQQFNLRSVVQTSQAVPKGAAFLFAGIDEFLYALALTFAASE